MLKFRKPKKQKESIVEDIRDRDIVLPTNIAEELNLEKDEHATLRIEGQKILIEFTNKVEDTQNVLLRWFLLPAIVTSIVFFVYFMNQKQVNFVGETSIANMTLILGLISGITCFIYFFIQGKRDKLNTASKDIYWRNFPAVLISFGIILVLVVMLFFEAMSTLFGGASFDLWTATALFFLFGCVINYFMIHVSLTLTPSMLTNILIIVIIGGVASAMITNSEQQWWQYNFSFLGTPDASNSWRFNITLMFSALLMIGLIDYLFVMIQKSIPSNARLMMLRVLLILTAICLGGVGLFPYNELKYFRIIHDYVARAMVVLIIIIIIGLRWLLPKISKDFLKLSYLIGFALILTTVLFLVVGYLSLTVFELIAFILSFSWILLLLQNLQKMAQEMQHSFDVIVSSKQENSQLDAEGTQPQETMGS